MQSCAPNEVSAAAGLATSCDTLYERQCSVEVNVSCADSFAGWCRTFNEFDIADKLKMRGWVLPAYHMAPNAQ